MPNQRACDFADPPTEEEGGRTPKKVTQCKRVKFGGRRASPTRPYNSRGVQWGAKPAMNLSSAEARGRRTWPCRLCATLDRSYAEAYVNYPGLNLLDQFGKEKG